MLYELPTGTRCAMEINFSYALDIPKNPLQLRSNRIGAPPQFSAVPYLRVKKWGNGQNNSHTPGRAKDGAGHGNRSLKEISGKTAHT
jgi:hypothetical protein